MKDISTSEGKDPCRRINNGASKNVVDFEKSYLQKTDLALLCHFVLDDSNLLVIVIDTNPFEWEHPTAPLKLSEALQHILAFMNAHLAGRHDNRLAVIASHVGVR